MYGYVSFRECIFTVWRLFQRIPHCWKPYWNPCCCGNWNFSRRLFFRHDELFSWTQTTNWAVQDVAAILLMVQKSGDHQLRLVGYPHHLQGLIHPRWYINRTIRYGSIVTKFDHVFALKNDPQNTDIMNSYILIPRCSMYGLFTYIWVVFGW